MSSPLTATPRGFRFSRIVQLVALAVVASGVAAVPSGIVGARSNAPEQRPSGPPCTAAAANDSYSTPMDTELTEAAPGILGNDTVCSGYSLDVLTMTSNGALLVDIGTGAFSYTPNPGFVGVDTFTYELEPPIVPSFMPRAPRGLPTPAATVTITVDAPPCAPVAIDDAYSTPQNVVLNVALPGVRVNDTHCDFFVHLFSNPSNGTLALNADGTFQYTPNAGFSGVDSFQYALAEIMPGFSGGPRRGVWGWRAPQGAADNVATVTITVTPPPPTTTSTSTTTTTTTTPAPTTTTVPPAILPATQ